MTVASTPITTATTTPTYVLPSVKYKSNYEIVTTFFKEKAKDVAKVISYGCGWAAQVHPANTTLSSASKGTKNVKNFISAAEVPEKVRKTGDSVRAFLAKPSVATGRNVLKEATGLVNSTCDGIDFSSNWLAIPPKALNGVSLVNSGATFLGCGNSAIEQAESINKEARNIREGKEFNEKLIHLNMINIARDVSYVAVGVLGILVAGFGVAIAPWAFLAVLTSGLFFTTVGYFHERIVDPEKKNYDKDQMIKDQVAMIEQAKLAAQKP